jgi:hypothetical protein
VKLTPVQADGLWGYENSKGEYVIKPQFDAVGHLEAISENDAGYVDCKFINGRVFVELNGKSGFINKRGKFEEQ